MAYVNPFLQGTYSGYNYELRPSYEAAQQAGSIRAQGATTAGQLGKQYLEQALGSLQRGYGTGQGFRQPYIGAGETALGSALDYTGLSGKPQEQVLSEFRTSPRYQFNVQEMTDALEKSAASRGKLYSGSFAKALQDRTSALASTEYDKQLSDRMALLDRASPFAQDQARSAYDLGLDTGAYQGAIGKTLSDSELGRSEALARALELMGSAQAEGMVRPSTISGRNRQASALAAASGEPYQSWDDYREARGGFLGGDAQGGGGGGGAGGTGRYTSTAGGGGGLSTSQQRQRQTAADRAESIRQRADETSGLDYSGEDTYSPFGGATENVADIIAGAIPGMGGSYGAPSPDIVTQPATTSPFTPSGKIPNYLTSGGRRDQPDYLTTSPFNTSAPSNKRILNNIRATQQAIDSLIGQSTSDPSRAFRRQAQLDKLYARLKAQQKELR